MREQERKNFTGGMVLPVLLCWCCSVLHAQTAQLNYDSLGKQKDAIDVLQQVFLHKKEPRNGETANAEKHISIAPAFGYTLQTGFAGIVSGNAAIQSKKYPQQNISAITSYIAYTQYSQLLFNTQTTFWAANNKYNFIGDWRYMKYPTNNYGIGSRSPVENEYTVSYNYIRFHEAALRNIGRSWYAGAGYQLDYHWNIKEYDLPANEPKTDFDRYGFHKNSISSGLTLNLLQDNRFNPINPRGGWYGKMVLRSNFTWLGSNSNWESLLIDLRKYIPINRGKQVLALWSYNWFTLGGTSPYLDMPSLGWDTYNNTGRGYIQSRFQGKNMLYDEAEFRFPISRSGLLGGVLFTNVHTFSEWPNNKFNQLNPGYGAGLRIKLNKFSNTNVAIDYGLGLQGSRGLFVNLGEVF